MGKHQSGAYKRKKKAEEQNLINKSYKGGMDKFVRKKPPQVLSGNQSVDPSTLALAIVPYNDDRDGQTETDNMEVKEDHIDVNLNSSPREDVDDSFKSDIFDPRNWNSLDSKQIDILAQKGPKRENKLRKIPKIDMDMSCAVEWKKTSNY